MSMGLEAVYRLLKIENDMVIYAYSGDNFSYPFDKELARSYDGRIEMSLSAFKNINSFDLFEKGKVKIIKECFCAEKNTFGIDILAIRTISHILRKYRETSEIPKEGHWII
jgi:DNA polymerase elongation subunit (family B)